MINIWVWFSTKYKSTEPYLTTPVRLPADGKCCLSRSRCFWNVVEAFRMHSWNRSTATLVSESDSGLRAVAECGRSSRTASATWCATCVSVRGVRPWRFQGHPAVDCEGEDSRVLVSKHESASKFWKEKVRTPRNITQGQRCILYMYIICIYSIALRTWRVVASIRRRCLAKLCCSVCMYPADGAEASAWGAKDQPGLGTTGSDSLARMPLVAARSAFSRRRSNWSSLIRPWKCGTRVFMLRLLNAENRQTHHTRMVWHGRMKVFERKESGGKKEWGGRGVQR